LTGYKEKCFHGEDSQALEQVTHSSPAVYVLGDAINLGATQ